MRARRRRAGATAGVVMPANAFLTAVSTLCALALVAGAAQAQSVQPAAGSAEAPTASATAERTRYVSPAWNAGPKSELPQYVKLYELFEVAGRENAKWFEFGLEQRTRYELRQNDYRKPFLAQDNLWLLRSRMYIGVREVLDPFRFTVELMDSRRFHSRFPEVETDVNEFDLLQGFGELYFDDLLGKGQPLRVQAGRFTLEYNRAHLVSRPYWPNALPAFDGIRVRMGELKSDWQLDIVAARPVERRFRKLDRSDEERMLYGLFGAWRKWDDVITIEPYYIVLDEDRKEQPNDREIHTLGFHVFGPIGKTGFDYDVDQYWQFGETTNGNHFGYVSFVELGYTFPHPWKPRLSFTHFYGSGDLDPIDGDDDRFERLFGVAHVYSTSDLIDLRNMNSPKLRLEVQPTKKLQVVTSYGGYWLASADDAWPIPGRRDPAGSSGTFLGTEAELRVRYWLTPDVQLELGYSHFFMGSFVERTGEARDLDFLYLQTTIRL